MISYIKKKFLFFNISIKKHFFSYLFIFFILGLIIFSGSNLPAAKNGLKLWANNVVPSLFPFFIATELLSHTNISYKFSKFFSNIMRPVFNVPGIGAYAFILGIISGYPVGAKIVTSFRNSNLCTQDEGSRMLCFTNNSSPLFIIGTVGITLFSNSTIGFLLFTTHILASITVGFLFGFLSKFKKLSNNKIHNTEYFKNYKECSFNNLGEILGSSIMNSIKTILMIGGFIVLFSVFISILNNSYFLNLISYLLFPIFKLFNIDFSFIKPIFIGFLELTNGVAQISSIPSKMISLNIIFCSLLLGFGGISVLLQVLSITSKSDLSIKPYIYGKLLQGIFAAFYTYIFISSFSTFNFNL